MDRKNVSFFISGLLLGLIVAVAGFSLVTRNQSGSDSRKVVLKLGHALDQSHPVHLGMVYMKEKLDSLSGGSVELQIFPNGQLGSETESIEQLQRGALAMTKVSAAPMESFLPEFAVFSLPYVFKNEEHYWRVLGSPVGRKLLTMPSKVGLRGLCYYDSGSRNFYTTSKPVLKPDDLIGMKIRVMKNKTSMDMIEVLGGSPTPIPWGELYTALQQHMVDGAENNPPSFYTNRHFEVCKFFSMDHHTRIPDMLFISEQVWQRLSPQVQEWLQQAADMSVIYQRKLWQKMTAESIEAVRKEGVEIFYPDMAPFEQKVQPMLASYQGTPVGDLLREIQEIE